MDRHTHGRKKKKEIKEGRKEKEIRTGYYRTEYSDIINHQYPHLSSSPVCVALVILIGLHDVAFVIMIGLHISDLF